MANSNEIDLTDRIGYLKEQFKQQFIDLAYKEGITVQLGISLDDERDEFTEKLAIPLDLIHKDVTCFSWWNAMCSEMIFSILDNKEFGVSLQEFEVSAQIVDVGTVHARVIFIAEATVSEISP